MRKKMLTSILLSTLSLIAYESIYDGSGSLIHPLISQNEIDKGLSWGANRDEADMQPHKDKTSTVTFQVLYNKKECSHIDIHSNYDLKQKVKINLKSWNSEQITESYLAKLPVGKFSDKDGISIDVNQNYWTTLSITTTKPLNKKAEIYAYCRSDKDNKNIYDLEKISPEMTKLSNNYVYMGNGSLINRLITDNGQDGYGIKYDEAVASNSQYNAETMFQIQSSDKCQKITIEDKDNSTKVEDILFKIWNESSWRESNCHALPCELNTIFNKKGNSDYLLVKIKTKKGENNHLTVRCGTKDIKIELNEKESKFKNQNNCQFNDVSKSNKNYQYITALCSSQIFEGDKEDNYQIFKPDESIKWEKFVKIVNLANNFYKTQSIIDEEEEELNLLLGNIFISILNDNYNFEYDKDTPVTNNMSFTYFAMIFWDEFLEPNEAKGFLKKKIKNIANIDLSDTLNRGDMARLVLQLAKLSANDNGINRKLPYLNYSINDLNIDKKKDIPVPFLRKPTFIDNSKEKVAKTISNNIEEVKNNNITTSKKGSTDNLGLTKAILGGDNNLKKEFQKKKANEIIEEYRKNSWVDTTLKTTEKEPTIEIFDKDNKESLILTNVTEKDSKGKNKVLVENKSGEVNVISTDELSKKGYKSRGKIKAIDLIKDKLPTNLKSTIKKTGQTKSYLKYDDGYYQAGITNSYTRDNTKEVITDNITGLMWQDNVEAKTIIKPYVTKVNYDDGRDNDYSGDTAINYCKNLKLGNFTDWRLPTVKELINIGDSGRSKPSINPIFKNISLKPYMSSTLYTVINRDAPWVVFFNSFTMTGSPAQYDLSQKQYIRCVRENK